MLRMLDAKSTERKFAEFYNLYTAQFKHDVAVYLDLAAKFEGPILEIGCATGRVIGHLAAAGHQVHGIDTSRPMLELARRHLEPLEARASIADFDLRSAPLAERFGVALAPLFAFNALIDIEEQRLFLRHLVRSLEPGALLVLDLFCPVSLVRGMAAQTKEIEYSVAGRQLRVRDRREMLTPLLERRTQCFRMDAGPETEVVSHRRYVPPFYAASLLAESGFENLRWILNYDLSSQGPIPDNATPGGPFMVIAEL
jgi:SAM-dependent methyltransferase